MSHIYMNRPRIDRRDPGVCFVNEQADICRQIVDPQGNIRNFPGIQFDDALKREYASFRGEPTVRHQMEFGQMEKDRIAVLWTIRPEYFDPGDDWGFGREEIPAVQLCSYLDAQGQFTQPFRLYAIGNRRFTPDQE